MIPCAIAQHIDYRLSLEVAVIQALARRLVAMLGERDPLSERVHLKAPGVAAVGLIGVAIAIIVAVKP